MHETTVRFTDELWARVQHASRRDGISAAQYVRDATLTRLAVETQLAPLRREIASALRSLDQRQRSVEETLRRHGLR